MSTNSSTPNINVPISIEPTDEYQIQEISYDGQENYIPPLSMSENLSRLIQKIDFNQSIDELKEEIDGQQDDEESDTRSANKPPSIPSWPFDSMRAKLRVALTEICVLVDVLTIAKEKKYMIFDAVNPIPVDQRNIVSLVAKKRALLSAADVLLTGTSTLKTINSPLEPNFYDELREMRQSWRLKRIGNNIIGDLSYFRPRGYKSFASSRFEVLKTGPGARGPSNQALAVRVPRDLEGRAHIQVSVIKNDEIPLVEFSTSANGRCHESSRDGTWQDKLEAAQNVLFCKELFCHLANQAVEYQFVIPTTVTGNQIILALFPDVKLYITLIHRTPNTKSSRELSDGMKKLQEEHKPVFEHSLHKMLRDFYANKLRSMQGRGFVKGKEFFLNQMVEQAQHLIMRQQTMEVIDSFAAKIKDPLIISHWFCLNSPTTSIVRVDIVSHNNEILGRSHMLIYIGTRQLRVITRDCKNLLLGYEPDELRHLLIWQSCLHQFIASDKLAKLLGWYTLVLNYSVNVARQELNSTAFSLVICSSNCSHLISIKSGPQFGLTVDVAEFKKPSISSLNGPKEMNIESILNVSLKENEQTIQLNRLHDLVDNFREVDWDQMQGRDFLTKLELLMSALTDLK